MNFSQDSHQSRPRPARLIYNARVISAMAIVALAANACGAAGSETTSSSVSSPVRGTPVATSAGGSSSVSTAAAGGPSALEGKTVEIVGPEAGDPFYGEVACGAQDAGRKLGLAVSKAQSAPNQSQAQQNTIVTNVLSKKPSALIYTPADPIAGGIPLHGISQNDVAVVNVDAQLADSSLYTSFISSNHNEGAQLITKVLADQMGGEGQIAAIGSLPSNPDHSGADQWVQGSPIGLP